MGKLGTLKRWNIPIMGKGNFMQCYIIGGHGKLGRLIAKKLGAEPTVTTTLIGRSQTVDIDGQSWSQRINPDDIIINCAALLGTNICETRRQQAVADNSNLTFSILQTIPHKVKYIYVSTEAVFGANESGILPVETNTPVPLNWYSVTKRLGELTSLSFGGKVVRLPLLVDFDDTNTLFGKLRREIESNREIRLAQNVFSTPLTYSSASAELTKVISHFDQYPNVVHLTGENYLSIAGIFDLYLENRKLGNNLVNYFEASIDSLNLIDGGLGSSVIEPLNFDVVTGGNNE